MQLLTGEDAQLLHDENIAEGGHSKVGNLAGGFGESLKKSRKEFFQSSSISATRITTQRLVTWTWSYRSKANVHDVHQYGAPCGLKGGWRRFTAWVL